jgi:putative spermidine/putrescine transport system substrate-binding protein
MKALLGKFSVLSLLCAILLAACVAPASNSGQAGGAAAAPAAAPSVVNVYSDGDTNITDWFSNIVKPAFEKQYPQYKVNFINVRGAGDGTKTIADRALAAMKTNSDPQAEVLDFDSLGYPDLVKAGLWLKLDESNVPNAKNIAKAARVTDFSMAYRGSQVLIAYDSAKIPEKEVPKTFADLIAWIKAHPGQFAYCRPDKGGSGGNFVVRAIYEVTGKDPTKFKAGPADPALLKEFDKAWALLRDIHPAIYDNGSYPAGNNPTLQLLANGSVSMISAWSDQSMQALNKGVLPANIKLLQFTDLPMPGGYAPFSVPANAKNKQGALDFVNFMLTPDMQVSVVKEIGGFPAVEWTTLPKELQSQFTSVITNNVPSWPGGEYSAARNKGWYENVATNLKQGQ